MKKPEFYIKRIISQKIIGYSLNPTRQHISYIVDTDNKGIISCYRTINLEEVATDSINLTREQLLLNYTLTEPEVVVTPATMSDIWESNLKRKRWAWVFGKDQCDDCDKGGKFK